MDEIYIILKELIQEWRT